MSESAATTIRVILNGEEQDLRDIPPGTPTAIYPGTFDPCHPGHIHTAEEAFASPGAPESELVLLYPHTHASKRRITDYSVRVEIADLVIGPRPDIGILLVPPHWQESWNMARVFGGIPFVRPLFAALQAYHPLEYRHLTSTERLAKALSDRLAIPRLIIERDQAATEPLPEGFYQVDGHGLKISSTDIRAGRDPVPSIYRPFVGERYARLEGLLKQVYPLADLDQA